METKCYDDYEIMIDENIGISIRIMPLGILGIDSWMYFPKKYCGDLLSAMQEAKHNYLQYKELAMCVNVKNAVQELVLRDIVLSHCFWKDLADFVYLGCNIQLSFYFCVSKIDNETVEYSLDIITSPLKDENHNCLGPHITLCSEQEIDKFIKAIAVV